MLCVPRARPGHQLRGGMAHASIASAACTPYKIYILSLCVCVCVCVCRVHVCACVQPIESQGVDGLGLGLGLVLGLRMDGYRLLKMVFSGNPW